MKILLHGLNYAPEEIGIGKYSGEMIQWLAERGHECVVVTTPPYYPAWKIERPWKGGRYEREKKGSGFRVQSSGKDNGYEGSGDAGLSPGLESPTSPARRESETQRAASEWGRNEISGRPSPTAETVDFPRRRVNFENGTTESRGEEDRRAAIEVIRCPLWVPKKVTGLKRVIHLASFGLSCIPAVLWKAITFRPDVILTVEPAAMCMPTTWIASRICGAKCWLHVQDFEVDAAFDLGILKQPLLKKVVLALEGFLMRRFDRVSSISPNMMLKAAQKGVDEDRLIAFPNWVDCDLVYPIPHEVTHRAEGLRERRRSFGLPPEKITALYAGNIGKKQGLEIVLEAAQQVPDVEFVICGTGADAESLQSQASGITNIYWLTPQPSERFNDLLNCADMHLLPQRAGAADLVMPSKLTGMMASGRPVVACANAGTQIADVVQGRGKVVDAGDAQAFAKAITWLVDHPEDRKDLGRAARTYAVTHLSREAILHQFECDLREVSGRVASTELPPESNRLSEVEAVG